MLHAHFLFMNYILYRMKTVGLYSPNMHLEVDTFVKLNAKPRALVDLDAAVSYTLLINEHQWVGILVRPLNYSLKAAVLHIDTGPGLEIEETNIVEMESYAGVSENDEDDASNLTAETLKRAYDEVLATVVFC
ncbi:hypothetical protein KIW84_063053 [Lathyrus oleraceus]|uniref:Uncharacterized protein n=1 Tax=Pisum sativum TaxID=3888 RepID=A0A9D4W6N7_PEA|nr:hypothetical protein KIW84_063053 [Pisum sativum]